MFRRGLVLSFFFGVMAFGFQEIKQPVEKVYLPDGFDSDDNVQIVVSGSFPDSCYKFGIFGSTVSSAAMEIRLDLTATTTEGPKCLKVPVPFYRTMWLGRMPGEGTYTVVDRVSKKALGKINIKMASEAGAGTDEENYAPLLDANLDRDSRTISLEGIFPLSCLKIDNVRAENQKDTVVVLPSFRQQPGLECLPGKFPFSEKVDLKIELPKQTFLLHVRSMGGQAIHKMIVGDSEG